MSHQETARENLDYVASTLRRARQSAGDAPIYFLWAVLVPIGFALFDFAPRFTGLYWFVIGIGGGVLSWWLGAREAKRQGMVDRDLGRRYGWHWGISGIGFFLAGLPMIVGVIDPAEGASLFLLVGGLVYLLAGLHLDGGMLPGGVLMLVAYVVLIVTSLPYVWTVAGLVIALALALAGFRARRFEARPVQ